MAKMTFKLPEETIRKMEALGSHYDAVTSAVLEEGVKPLYDAAKQSLSSVIGQGTKEPWESTHGTQMEPVQEIPSGILRRIQSGLSAPIRRMDREESILWRN